MRPPNAEFSNLCSIYLICHLWGNFQPIHFHSKWQMCEKVARHWLEHFEPNLCSHFDTKRNFGHFHAENTCKSTQKGTNQAELSIFWPNLSDYDTFLAFSAWFTENDQNVQKDGKQAELSTLRKFYLHIRFEFCFICLRCDFYECYPTILQQLTKRLEVKPNAFRSCFRLGADIDTQATSSAFEANTSTPLCRNETYERCESGPHQLHRRKRLWSCQIQFSVWTPYPLQLWIGNKPFVRFLFTTASHNCCCARELPNLARSRPELVLEPSVCACASLHNCRCTI